MKALVMGGKGKVGSAIVNLITDAYGSAYILDLAHDAVPSLIEMDFMHVCIPYSENFLRQVKLAICAYRPTYVIIHSTVPVGTCRKIGKNVAHSPIRGQHDQLKEAVKTFVKYVAGVTPHVGKECENHLRSLGIPVVRWNKPEETELNKLMCLSRFLNDLAFYEVAENLSKKFGVTPARLREWTWSYNHAYAGTEFCRPELKFPKGKAGGTCVFPVSDMLFQQTKNPWLKKNLDMFRPLQKKK